jgi:23S rRNA (uracil1939-C5)-methyltransferase
MRPSRGEELELTIDSLAYGGNGVARLDGYVVFVAGGVPGDRVRAVVGKAKRTYAEARAVEIVEPAPDRLPEVADHPGAPWQVLPYERQLQVKAQQVAEAPRPDRQARGLRARADRAGRAAMALPQQARVLLRNRRRGELVCGFHAPGRFDRILP